MSDRKENTADELARRKLEGIPYSQLRSELRENGYSSSEISDLIREADEKVLRETASGGTKHQPQKWYRAGLIVAVAGLIISVAYNAGIILQNLSPLAAYSPFLAGILIMVYARIEQRRKKEPVKKGTGNIRKKRPYK